MTDQQDYGQLKQQSDLLYQKFGRPLEKRHQGKYLAISPDGKKTILGKTLLEVVTRASETLGPGNFVFKIGTKSVGTML